MLRKALGFVFLIASLPFFALAAACIAWCVTKLTQPNLSGAEIVLPIVAAGLVSWPSIRIGKRIFGGGVKRLSDESEKASATTE